MPGVEGCNKPLLYPKAGKLFRMAFPGYPARDDEGFRVQGVNLIDRYRL